MAQVQVDRTYKYKVSKRQSNTLKKNIEGDLKIVIKEVDEDGDIDFTKQKIRKNKVGEEYRINPIINIDVLQKKEISKTNMNKLLKGLKINLVQLDRKTGTRKPIEMALQNEKFVNARLLNNNRQWKFRIDYSGDRGLIKKLNPPQNLNLTGSFEELEERIKDYIFDITNNLHGFNWLPDVDTTLELLEPIELIDSNDMLLTFNYFKDLNGDEEYYIEKKRKHAELRNLYNELIEPVENPSNINCCVFYFKDLYEKKKKKIYKTIYTELKEVYDKKKTIFLNDLKNIFDNNKEEITIYLYSIDGLIYENYSNKYTEVLRCGKIILYIEDNHLYVIKSTKHKDHLTKKTIKKYDKAYIQKYHEEIEPNTFLNSFLLNINIDSKDDTPKFLFYKEDENKLITNNEHLDILKKYVSKLGLDKKILGCNTSNFINRVKEKYNINCYSIFPYLINNYVLLYKNNEIIQDENDKTLLNIDKNKCFSNALFDAPFIPIFNIFTNKMRKYEDNEDIIEHYIYFIEVLKPNNIYFNSNYRTGYYINKVGYKKDDIKIKYVFECDIIKDKDDNIYNPFSCLINDIYSFTETEKEQTFIKNSINAFIGQMLNPQNKTVKVKTNIKYSNINDLKLQYSNQIKKEVEIDLDTGEPKNIDNVSYDDILKMMTISQDVGHCIDNVNPNYIFHWKNKDIFNNSMGEDNKPLHILITDISQLYILDMIEKLKIKKDDIIEINTDCIYIKNSDKYDLNKIDVDDNDFKKWKLQKGLKESQIKNVNNISNDSEPIKMKYFYETNNNQYNINIEYAGGGKTYRIIKTIEKELKKNPNYSYIIFSCFHDFISDYRKKGLNAHTIASYTFHDKSIKEKNIYIDEFGVCSLTDILYIFRHDNKIINIFGDLKQLQPVKSPKINIDFLKEISNNFNTEWTNRRNTFTKEYYDQLIETKNIEDINNIVNKYNYPINKADKIIAFYNDTVDKYNNKMLLDNKQKFDNEEISLGIPITNTENRLEIEKSTGEKVFIFNRHSFIIKSELQDNKYIIDDELNQYIIDKDTLLKYFVVSYCITLYGAQGKTYNSVHYVNEDKDRKALIKDGALYTLISRLKFDDEDKYIKNVLKVNKKTIKNKN